MTSKAWVILGSGGRKKKKETLLYFLTSFRSTPLFTFPPCPPCDAKYVYGSDLHDGALMAAFPSGGSLGVCVKVCVCVLFRSCWLTDSRFNAHGLDASRLRAAAGATSSDRHLIPRQSEKFVFLQLGVAARHSACIFDLAKGFAGARASRN